MPRILARRSREWSAREFALDSLTRGAGDDSWVDALDEQSVDAHVRDVISKAGTVDVSFNLIKRGDVHR
jgi:hypothetical protein